MDIPQDDDAIWLVGLPPSPCHPILGFLIPLRGCWHKGFLNQREMEFNFL